MTRSPGVLLDVTTSGIMLLPLERNLDGESFIKITPVDISKTKAAVLMDQLVGGSFNWAGVFHLGILGVLCAHRGSFRWSFIGDSAGAFLVPGCVLWSVGCRVGLFLMAIFFAHVLIVSINMLRMRQSA